MGKYQGIDCPICKRPLENGEPIVICPDCGTPYHKSCVNTVGHCIHEDWHTSGKTFELPTAEEKTEADEEKYAADEEKRCSRCGTMNPVGGLFCMVCGNPLTSHRQQQGQGDMAQSYHQPHRQMPYDPYNTPFGGVSADEQIAEIPVRDWAIFIGQNTAYFIPKFKDTVDHAKSTGFNFVAMLLGGIYLMYRKMYLWGALLLAFRLLITVPGLLLQLDIMREMMGAGPIYTNDTVILLNNICGAVNLVVMGLCGAFANRLYLWHCKKKIGQLQQKFKDDTQYRAGLTQTGSVSRMVIVLIIAGYFLLSMGLSMWLVQSILQ